MSSLYKVDLTDMSTTSDGIQADISMSAFIWILSVDVPGPMTNPM